MHNFKKTGFTLVEILLTLTIIGVVAALTIPTLVATITKKQYETGFKNAYSILTAATGKILNDNSGDLANKFATGADIRNAYAGELKVLKNCDQASFFANCWYPKDDVKSLNGWLHLDHYNDIVDDFRVGGQGLALSNGMLLYFNTNWGFSSDCNNVEDGIGPECLMLWIDSNGYKDPNTLGRDIFIFVLNNQAVVPWGNLTNNNLYCNPSTADSWNGMDCALRLAKDGDMNY